MVTVGLYAQIPRIQKVEPLATYPNNRILISGSGFSSTSSELQVWFDDVKGSIATCSASAIEVDVPAQARLNNIEVINLSSGLSAKSILKFMPSFSGEPFDGTKFTAPLSFSSPTELWDLCSCDFNNDSKPDIAVTKFFSPSNNLMILTNQSTPGNIAFSKVDLGITFPSDNAVCGDLDGDGKPELIISRSGSPRNSIHIFKNVSAGSVAFAAPINLFLEVSHFATRISIRDLNQDGKPDLIVTNSFNNVLYVFRNTTASGTLGFASPPTEIPIVNAATNYGVEVQDFDGDGLPDLAITPFQSNDIFLLRNQSSGSITFGTAQKITLSGTLNSINSADINQDGKADLVVTNTINNQVHVLLNQSVPGTFSFNTALVLAASNGPWGVDVSDIDGDKDPDLIVTNRNVATLNVFLHSGNFNSPGFTKVDLATSKPSRNVKSGDLDGDGKPDLAVTTFNASTSTYTLDILRNKNCHVPEILNEQPLVLCAGQTIRLKTVPANNVTFTWQKNGVPFKTGTDAYADITAADSYTVTANGEAGACAISSAPVVVTTSSGTVPSDPVITASTPICTGSNLNLSTAAVAGGSYTWTGPDNFISADQNPTITDVDIQNTGLYTLQVALGSCKSNPVSKRIDIVDLDDITVSSSLPSNMICQGGTLSLSVASDPTYTYQWTKDGVNISGQTANTLTVSQSGNYGVTITIASVTCTKTAGPVSVTVVNPPVASFDVKANACIGELITFTSQSTVASGTTPVYNWNFGDGNTGLSASTTHQYASAQSFTTSLSVSYSGITGCSSSTSKSIAISNASPPVIAATEQELCPGESSNLSLAGSYTSATWSNGDTGNSITVTQAGTFSVVTLDANGCTGNDEIIISSKPVPAVQATTEKSAIAPGESVQLGASGAESYSWSPTESLSNSLIENPIASPVTTTTYTVTGTLTGGCSADASVTVTVDGSAIIIKPLPAFSPNGDGSNEVWTIEGSDIYPDCVLAVFDGKGRRVYEKKGYNNDWNGTYNDRPVPDGTYFFVFGCPEKKPVTGSVLIFR